jgi:hypothetical protein
MQTAAVRVDATEDLFTPIHKGLRSMIYSLASRIQSNDFGDLPASTALAVDMEHDFELARAAGCIVCILHHHAEDEEKRIFPAVSEFGPELVAALIEEHHELTRREAALTTRAREILAMERAADRIRAGEQLNRSANDLFALYVAHMNREDNDLVPLMRRHFTNEQMAAMRGAIMAGMPPERLFAILGWMLPSLTAFELADLVGALKRGAPPPLVEAVAKIASAKVEPARWERVRREVGL